MLRPDLHQHRPEVEGVPRRTDAERKLALSAALEARGYRLTNARRVILEELVGIGGHISADGLAEMVRHVSPGIGRMTVYRTLDLLCQLGSIRPVYQGTGAAHYILLDQGHHHHLICSACGTLIEVEECVLHEIEQVVSRQFGFQIEGHLLEFYGKCQGCQLPDVP